MLTRPLVEAGVRLWAIEPDLVWADRLRSLVDTLDATDRVRIIETDVRRLRFPREPYRVVANPPFGLTTELLAMLLDRPERGPSEQTWCSRRRSPAGMQRRRPSHCGPRGGLRGGNSNSASRSAGTRSDLARRSMRRC